eukprot:CAMPEP_0169473634 /NCGR_PEP_ID=MMETSP1042-20121227/25818_1 /TAXON_ID=464988 /ORGANISM="Hemiselmis andersenii, Strain CCMP1180" /LENGTH=117 /DNA_ID=CAMNT_0009587591 /DNA_START=371 /DNA_END=724 /DNA_ORIENTATION=+
MEHLTHSGLPQSQHALYTALHLRYLQHECSLSATSSCALVFGRGYSRTRSMNTALSVLTTVAPILSDSRTTGSDGKYSPAVIAADATEKAGLIPAPSLMPEPMVMVTTTATFVATLF